MKILRLRYSVPLTSIVITLIVFLLLTVPATANYDNCGVPNGQSSSCNNYMSFNDALAYATNRMVDSFDAPNPYYIHFSMTQWYPTVTRGAPIYTNYWITDNFNGGQVIYLNSSYNGRHLNDFYSVNIGLNATAGYYPNQNPSTAMEIRNADPPVSVLSSGVNASSASG